MTRWLRPMTERPVWVLAAVLGFTLFCLAGLVDPRTGAPRLGIDPSATGMLPSGGEERELYEKARRDDDLADLRSTQIEGARRRGDVTADLAFQVRLGEICESRWGDRARAIETYRGVLERDPQHGGALEALARLLQSEGELGEAARILERLLEQAKGEQAVRRAVELAGLHEQLGSKTAALAALERGAAAGELTPELVAPLRALYQDVDRPGRLISLKGWRSDTDLEAAMLTLSPGLDSRIRELGASVDHFAGRLRAEVDRTGSAEIPG